MHSKVGWSNLIVYVHFMLFKYIYNYRTIKNDLLASNKVSTQIKILSTLYKNCLLKLKLDSLLLLYVSITSILFFKFFIMVIVGRFFLLFRLGFMRTTCILLLLLSFFLWYLGCIDVD